MPTGILSAFRSHRLSGVSMLEVQGLRIRLEGDWPEVLDEVRRDYAWFDRGDGGRAADLTVAIERRAPELDRFGHVPASFVTPRNVVFQHDGISIIDYFGRAAAVLDRDRLHLVVQGEDRHLVREAVYLYLLSRIGEHLEHRGFVRLHALGLAGAQGGVAVMLPSGGGKSTLALRAMRADGVRLVSEDSPLLDRRGHLHPFPLPIGINATDAQLVGSERVRRIERMEFHPKLVLDLEAFADRVQSAPVALRHLVVGRRALGSDARLERVPRRAAIGALTREAIVGVGIYQGMEFILQRGLRDLAGKVGVAAGRTRCCAAGLVRAQVWLATLGSDRERNWQVLEPLLR